MVSDAAIGRTVIVNTSCPETITQCACQTVLAKIKQFKTKKRRKHNVHQLTNQSWLSTKQSRRWLAAGKNERRPMPAKIIVPQRWPAPSLTFRNFIIIIHLHLLINDADVRTSRNINIFSIFEIQRNLLSIAKHLYFLYL